MFASNTTAKNMLAVKMRGLFLKRIISLEKYLPVLAAAAKMLYSQKLIYY